ncbi:MAG TPA: hypothetical protein V6D27_09805, partial [Vampirovibrionales bacterium]
MSNHRHWLETTEYASLFASVVASIVAVFFNGAIYVAAPLICSSLILNAIARYRVEHQTRRMSGTTNRLHRQWAEELEMLTQRVEAQKQFPLPQVTLEEGSPPPIATGSPEELAQFQTRLAKLESVDLSQIQGEIAGLKEQYALLDESLGNAIAYLNRSSFAYRLERVEETISQLTSQIVAPSPRPQPEPTTPEPAKSKPPSSKIVLPSFASPSEPTVQNWICRHSLPAHADWVRSLGITPDGQILATGSFDTSIKLWNLTTGELLQVLAEHKRGVFSIA